MSDDGVGGSVPNLEGVVCPFHAAVINPANAEPDGAPPAASVGERNSLTLLYRHAQFHAGFNRTTAIATVLVGILGGKKWTGVLRNALTWSYDPSELSLSPLNKHPQNSGMVSRSLPGGFVEDRLERLLDDFGSTYNPLGAGPAERGISSDQLELFLDSIAVEAGFADRRRTFHRKLANAEIPVVMKAWGSESDSGLRYLGESAFRTLYGDHLYPTSASLPR